MYYDYVLFIVFKTLNASICECECMSSPVQFKDKCKFNV
jgi:hypothetical protein